MLDDLPTASEPLLGSVSEDYGMDDNDDIPGDHGWDDVKESTPVTRAIAG